MLLCALLLVPLLLLLVPLLLLLLLLLLCHEEEEEEDDEEEGRVPLLLLWRSPSGVRRTKRYTPPSFLTVPCDSMASSSSSSWSGRSSQLRPSSQQHGAG